MKARKEIDWQPVPIPEIPPMAKMKPEASVSRFSEGNILNVIPFPVREPRKEIKIPSMRCMKTDFIDWRF